jgi:hypothetical protein
MHQEDLQRVVGAKYQFVLDFVALAARSMVCWRHRRVTCLARPRSARWLLGTQPLDSLSSRGLRSRRFRFLTPFALAGVCRCHIHGSTKLGRSGLRFVARIACSVGC